MARNTYTWIIGASSGIGRALAVVLARRGETLALSSRNEAALAELASELGPTHLVLPLDVTNAQSFQSAISQLKLSWPSIDRALFFAGIYKPSTLAELDLEDVEKILQINLYGGFVFIKTVLPVMRAQAKGQIALCASVAAYRGLPGGQPYSATKAGLLNLAQSLRAETERSIDIKVINPGFVDTRLTRQNKFTMPALISPEAAATAIARGLDSNAFELHFPKRFTIPMKILRLLPDALYFRWLLGFCYVVHPWRS